MNQRLLLLPVAALAALALVGLRSTAHALVDNQFFIGGLQVDKTSVPELIVFNTSQVDMPPLTVTIFAADGTPLVTEPAALTLDVGPRATATLDLKTALVHAGPSGKPFSGVVTARVAGDSAFFSDQSAIVHATQYFGSRRKPRAGFVVRSVFTPGT
jgi:hypothetical protein